MNYDVSAIEGYFDELGWAEFERLEKSPLQRVKLHLHLECLTSFVRPESRLLEIGAGPGRFTQALAELGCQVVVTDLSSEQLRLNQQRAHELGYTDSVLAWIKADICDLSAIPPEPFDSILVFGGPFSYVLDRRDQALSECLARLKAEGNLLLSVMSKWGTTHAFLEAVLDLPASEVEAVLESGDITAATSPSSAGHYCHMFTAAELKNFLGSHGLQIDFISASNVLSTTWEALLEDDEQLEWAKKIEVIASQAPGALDAGTHIIAVARPVP